MIINTLIISKVLADFLAELVFVIFFFLEIWLH